MIDLYLVGGYVRDRYLGVTSHDVDFAVVAEGYFEMRNWLVYNNFQIFVENPQYLTIRAHFPKNGFKFAGEDFSKVTADFVLCRKDGSYYDGRRPDEVWGGSLMDDLARRDFTMNAMAIGSYGQLIDPFSGMIDLEHKILRCVGYAEERISEDALRAMRALRFSLTKGMQIDLDIFGVLQSDWLPPLMRKVSAERRVDELMRMGKYDTEHTIRILAGLTPDLRHAILADNISLIPSLKEFKNHG